MKSELQIERKKISDRENVMKRERVFYGERMSDETKNLTERKCYPDREL